MLRVQPFLTRLLRRPATRLERFADDCRAVALVEFAVVLPFLLVLAGGVYEVSRGVATSRHLSNVASSISQILATNTTGTVSYLDLHYAYDSAMLTLPEVLKDSASRGIAWNTDITISIAGIVFKPVVIGCTSGCTYAAQIAWTAAGRGRNCLTLQTAAPDTALPTTATLPADLFTPTANPNGGNAAPPYAIAVDVSYTWQPTLFTSVISPVVMKRSSFITPRYTSQVNYTVVSGDDGFGTACLVL